MTEVNEVANTQATGLGGEVLVSDNPNFSIFKLPNGKFDKRMKYHKFWSFTPTTNEDVEKYYMVFNDKENNLVTPMKEAKGTILTIKNVFFNPYEGFDEETGQTVYGVTSTIEDTNGNFYATSSKTVYYSLKNMFDVFGVPNQPNSRPIKIAIKDKQVNKNKQTVVEYVPAG